MNLRGVRHNKNAKPLWVPWTGNPWFLPPSSPLHPATPNPRA